jgi:hypothetical protein
VAAHGVALTSERRVVAVALTVQGVGNQWHARRYEHLVQIGYVSLAGWPHLLLKRGQRLPRSLCEPGLGMATKTRRGTPRFPA